MTVARREAGSIVLPGLVTAHSHAFQRALRGRTHRASGSFWSWRGLMYDLASRIGPDEVYALSRFAYLELARAGVAAVGEFHYVHHQPDGTPYDDRVVLADAAIRAARDVGLRVTLLRVLYHRAGFGRPAEGTQRRFSDADVEAGLRDAETLAARWRDDDGVRVGVAPHSVRACPIEWFEAARAVDGPLHAHVSEQRREIQECLAEHRCRPVALLEERGLLDAGLVAVHATHLDDREVRALGGSAVCLCRTTERDLGDGLARVRDLADAGARFCFGVDSHASSDPFEEARAAELDERVRLERRVVALHGTDLLEAATAGGDAALGFERSEDLVTLDADALALVGAPEAQLDDAVAFGASAACVRHLDVDGVRVVEDGRHADEPEIVRDYLAALRALEL